MYVQVTKAFFFYVHVLLNFHSDSNHRTWNNGVCLCECVCVCVCVCVSVCVCVCECILNWNWWQIQSRLSVLLQALFLCADMWLFLCESLFHIFSLSVFTFGGLIKEPTASIRPSVYLWATSNPVKSLFFFSHRDQSLHMCLHRLFSSKQRNCSWKSLY